ncbi:MAG: hypothetical protein EA377_14015 [Phycisphaerales bacterium]|nr:MAG: hypothetical protein EA377_14015 [Phycisphaerales bacterium]
MTFNEMLSTVLLPGAMCGLVAGLAVWLAAPSPSSRLKPRDRPARWRAPVAVIMPPLALAGALCWTLAIVENGLAFPPPQRWQRLSLLAIVAIPVGAVVGWRHQTKLDRTVGVVLIAAAVLWTLRPPPVVEHAMLWTIGVAAVSSLWWLAARPLAARRMPGGWDTALALTFFSAAIIFLGGRFLKLALLASSIGVALIFFSLASWTPNRRPREAMAAAVAMLLPGLLAVGFFYQQTDIHLAAYILLLIAPLSLWISALRPQRSLQLAGFSAVVVMLAGAVTWILLTVGVVADL